MTFLAILKICIKINLNGWIEKKNAVSSQKLQVCANVLLRIFYVSFSKKKNAKKL